jgi:hypothetical protein
MTMSSDGVAVRRFRFEEFDRTRLAELRISVKVADVRGPGTVRDKSISRPRAMLTANATQRSNYWTERNSAFRGSEPAGLWLRLLLASACVAILAAFAAAWRLDPDPSGSGTHRQLGLAACPTFERTGHGCPTCGMTTALAAIARGDFATAWQANHAGVFLAALAAGFAVWGGVGAWRGMPVGFANWDRPLAYWAGGTSAIALTTWAIRWQQWIGMSGQ